MKSSLFENISIDPATWRSRAEMLRLRSARSSDYALGEMLMRLAEQYERLAAATADRAAPELS